MGWLFEPAPSPFQTKLPPGTPIDWTDPCSQGLVVCVVANEGRGSNIKDIAMSRQNFAWRWGTDTNVGTGASIPFWTQAEQTLALRTTGGTDYQRIVPAYTQPGGIICPFVDMTKGCTLEFWGKSDAADGTGIFYGMMEITHVASGEKIRMEMDEGPNVYVRVSNALACDTPSYLTHAETPNHWVATITASGVCTIYGNGRALVTANIGALTTVANSMSVCNTTLIVTDTQWQGYFYKCSVYNYAMGPAGVAALAANPMRVLKSTEYPGIFASDALKVYQSYQLLEYVDGIVPVEPPSYPDPTNPDPQTTPPGTTGPPDRTPIVTPGFAPGFRLFQKDTEIRVKPWGSSDSYSIIRPFGGNSFEKGADI